MAVTNIRQTLALSVPNVDVQGDYSLLASANDGQSGPLARVTGKPVFACTANNTAAEAIAFAFPSTTIAGLNLAAGESRVLTAVFRGYGPTAAGAGAAKLDFIVQNVAGTLTMAGTANVPYGTAGATASFTMAATIVSSAITVTVTTGTGGVGPNNVCELYLAGPKGS